MAIQDGINYVLFGNPVSSSVISAATNLARNTGILPKHGNGAGSRTQSTTTRIVSSALPLWKLAGSNLYLVRLAGVSGATAVILGAYGSHRKYDEEKGESRAIFEVANRFHFFHSIALMAVPLTRRPKITAPLMMIGMILFSGTCYYRAFTGDKTLAQFAPMGGSILILAWLSMVL